MDVNDVLIDALKITGCGFFDILDWVAQSLFHTSEERQVYSSSNCWDLTHGDWASYVSELW